MFPPSPLSSPLTFSHVLPLRPPPAALIYSLPHPNPPNRSFILTGSSCPEGIERAGRLLPVRTGTALPEWVVLGRRADRFAAGAGGVVAAG